MNQKPREILVLALVAAVLLALNLIAAQFFVRIDLTKEKRYSLSQISRATADTLRYPIYATIYLEGDFPPVIREFQHGLETTLAELAQYSRGKLDYEFIDPSNNLALQKEFSDRGYRPVPVTVRVNATETRQQYMWPIAVFRSRDKEQYIDLLRGATLPNGGVDFVKAESDLEYKLVSVIRNLTTERRRLLGLLRGHGEWNDQEINEFGAELFNSYNLVDYDQRKLYPGVAISPEIKVLLVLQPKLPFTERDKYELDQYLMRGGRIFFLLNQQIIDMDMYQKRSTLTDLRALNLDDLFLKYGLKLNYDLALDLNSESTELFADGPGGGSFTSKKWPFFPVITAFPSRPVTRNIESVLLRYPSTIDTLSRAGVNHVVFLATSPRSRTLQGRQFLDVNEITANPAPASLFNKGPQITGVISEGVFNSLFAGREAPVDSLAPQKPTARFGAQNNPAQPGAIALISDGEFVRPRFFRGSYTYIPMDNKALALNVVDYLAGDEALTQIRSKDVIVRRLNPEKVKKHAAWIARLNLLGPILLLALFGLIWAWRRKRKYEWDKR